MDISSTIEQHHSPPEKANEHVASGGLQTYSWTRHALWPDAPVRTRDPQSVETSNISYLQIKLPLHHDSLSMRQNITSQAEEGAVAAAGSSSSFVARCFG